MNFKETLRDLRKKKGIKIRELARKSKVSASYISMLENGLLTNDPSEETIKKLQEALEDDVGVLMATSTTAGTTTFMKIKSNPKNAPKLRIFLDEIDKDNSALDKLLKFLKK